MWSGSGLRAERETLNVAEQALHDTPDDQRQLDLVLAAQALEGDEAAWDTVYNAHYLTIWNLSFVLTLDKELAEDLLQDTFLKVKQNIGQYRGECPLGGWIQTICRNHHRDAIKYLRRRAGNRSMDAMDESDKFWLDAARRTDRADPAEAWVTHLDVERALVQLGADEREAYLLMKVGGYTSEEAGKLVGVAATTMRSRLGKAREQLSNLLPAYGEEGT